MLRWLPLAVITGILVLVLPVWRWSRGWGPTPAIMVGVILLTVVAFTFSVVPA